MKFKLVKKVEEAPSTKTFFFKSEKKIDYLPGQYCYFTLPKLNYPDKRGATRHFTLSSSPTEKGFISLTTRVRQDSGYKKTLDELPIGSEIEVEGPNGTFILDSKTKDINVFIAGGIGITPFRSMTKYDVDTQTGNSIYLIYSNSDSNFPFGKEFTNWSKKNKNIKVEFFNSSKKGHLNGAEIKKFLKLWSLDVENCTFWIVAPPPMVDAVETELGKIGVSSGKILTEKFTGY